MALLNRLFSSKRKPPPQQGYGSSLQSYHNSFEFSKDQVRILLFRECERRGRKLLFDSKAVKKIPVSSVPQSSRKPRKGRKAEDLKKSEAIVEITNGCCYQYTRPPSDIKLLGEMIFGSVAMTLRGSTFKVHVGGTPPVFMLTKVANSPLKRESEHGLEDSYGSSINSMNEFFTGGSSSSDSKLCTSSGSCPLDVPLPSSFTSETSQFLTQTNKSGYPGSLEGDSGCYTSSDISLAGAHPNSSFSTSLTSPDSRKGSGESLSSLRRRWLRTASTSLDLDSNLSLTYNDSPISCGSFPAWNDEKPVRRTKLGMAVVISLTHHQKESMQEFLLKHAALLEKMAVRLNAAVERAYCRKELFVSMMYDASCDVEQCVEDILLGPPLTMPVWLGLLTSPSEHSKIASCFLQELCQTLEEFDTKDSNFFLSSLVTTVLTHHLGWVPTVTPGLNQRSRSAYLEVPSSCWNLEDFPTVNPHNALWAQAMDLYGALGNPLKASRTIIVSASTSKSCIETVERLLRITSYFIRCAIISRQDSKLEDFNFPTKVAVGLSTSNENGVQVSVDDHKSSSCILHPVSGKGSPLRSLHQNSTEINVVGNLQSHIQRRSRGISPLADKVTSRSENSLIVQETSFDFPFKQPSGVGLRRNKSYTSRISSAAVCDSRASKERHTLSHAGGIQKCFSTLNNDFKMFIDSCGPSQNPSIETSPALEDKVVFVLGENEDLITLKGRSESKSNVFGCINKTSSDGREKFQKQPLSYSGSEVESGFSECDSFELSPVQSACGNIVPSKDMSPDTSDASEVRPQSIGPRQSYLKNDENIASLTCARNFTLNEDIITVCNANSEVMVSKLSCVHSENGCNSALASSANLRSLARSVSVNLPVCYKSSKPELFTENLCLICATQIIDCDVKENMKPSKDLKIVCSRKSMKSLRRAHSTFSIKNQNVRSCKNVTLCQNCDLKLESSVTFSQNNQTRHFLKQQGGCVSAQPKDSKPNKLNFIELPLPVKKDEAEVSVSASEWGIAGSLIGGVSSHYIPERVLQGCVPLNFGWEVSLKRDLALEVQHPTLDPGLSEAVAIVANVDLCEVQLISSHTYVVERPGTLGIRAGLSQLVANMLESVHHMWKLHLSPDLCLSFLENRLQEILLRSQALSDLLLTVEFCDMDILTSTLSLEPNDIPLLMSVASTHSPEVTQRYGLSFR